ncbi:MAG: hypothetical protein H0W44_10665 [Gammaproteobacteria bacterium]|nr:hypothetical protein [Gammaproteobacteria bacterium]
MAHSSLNDPASNPNFLSQPLSLLELRDKLHDHLSQAAALASVASGDDFLDFHQDVLRDYGVLLDMEPKPTCLAILNN